MNIEKNSMLDFSWIILIVAFMSLSGCATRFDIERTARNDKPTKQEYSPIKKPNPVITPKSAQQDDLVNGRLAGNRDGIINTDTTLWQTSGCLGGPFGIAMAYVYEPNQSATLLLGHSPEYIAAYTDAYREAGRKKQIEEVWIGYLTGMLISVFSVALYFFVTAEGK